MRVEANAKVNFTLEVFGKRTDGYHALRSLVIPISLADTLEIERTDDGLISSDTGYDDDLCVKAAKALRARCGVARLGARIHVEKRIPAGGGLGGGSADAAAVLRALNGLWGLGLRSAELAEVGAQVGSDVPALTLGGPVVMEGRGERTTPLTDLRASPLDLVLVNPGVHSSTKEVYAACAPRLPGGPDATAEMVVALAAGDRGRIAAALVNDLQAPAVRLHPEIADALVSLRTAGVSAAMMSGSGSCVFGLVPDAETAGRISGDLRARGLEARPVQTVNASEICARFGK